MTRKFTISISSPPHREKLVADIFFGTEQSEQFAELSQDEGTLRIEFNPRRDRQFWEFSFEDVMEALSDAKARSIALGSQS